MTEPRYFFIGIGGSGMLPLALILEAKGFKIAGSDRSLDQHKLSAKFEFLKSRGVALFPQDGSGVAPGDIVVASTAVEETVPDVIAANKLGAPRLTRAELLSQLFNTAPCSIGIAGTSGKSTVTGMIGLMLEVCGKHPTVMNGAIMKNFISSTVPFASALVGHGDNFVSEVDESDGSITLFTPNVAVLNNVGFDHKPLEELRPLFQDFIAKAKTAVVNFDNDEAKALTQNLRSETKIYSFAIDADADLRATDIDEQPHGVSFSLSERGGESFPVSLSVPGRHNVLNAMGAVGAVRATGISLEDAAQAIASFKGLRRRLELVGIKNGVTVIDDFGHNPDKIAVAMDALHAFPGRILALFQPHGFGPLKLMRKELVETFVERMKPEDQVIFVDPVYQGGTVKRYVTSADLIADIVAAGRQAIHIADRNEAAVYLVANAQPHDRLIIMGARDDTLSAFAHDLLDSLP